jgi:hypothetical protein
VSELTKRQANRSSVKFQQNLTGHGDFFSSDCWKIIRPRRLDSLPLRNPANGHRLGGNMV